MNLELREKLDKANVDWDLANGVCNKILSCMRALDADSHFQAKLKLRLKLAQERRRRAGDRISAAFAKVTEEAGEDAAAQRPPIKTGEDVCHG